MVTPNHSVRVADIDADADAQAHAHSDVPAPALTVWYDGACPLCRREIGLYRDLQPLQPDAPLCFADVSDPATPVPDGTTREQLMARFHVRTSDGRWLSGARAFLALWASLPGWRWLSVAGRLPGAVWAMERAYRMFLRARPRLQRWAARLDRSASASAPTSLTHESTR